MLEALFGTRPRAELNELVVNDIRVAVVRKAIRNWRLGVYPPDGKVRMVAPRSISDEAIRQVVMKKLPWIQRHQARILAHRPPAPRMLTDGEQIFFRGETYCLRVVEVDQPPAVRLTEGLGIILSVRPGSGIKDKALVLEAWYRQELKQQIPPLLEKWQGIMGVSAAEWGIKKMKTRWGTCNCRDRRIWFNLELVKKPVHCLELIVVHELAHLLERSHNKRFKAIMDKFLPSWRLYRKELSSISLTQDLWQD